MVEADTVERVEQREAALDLVRFDHALEDVLDRDGLALTRQVVRDGEDGPEVVGRVPPWKERRCYLLAMWKRRDGDTLHSAARKQSLKSNQRTIVPMLNAPRIGSS